MLEKILITLCVVVGIGVLAIFIFFFCTRKSCMSKTIYRRRPEDVEGAALPDVAVISDDQGNRVVISGLREGAPSQFHWKPPSYDEVAALPSYEEATNPEEDPEQVEHADAEVTNRPETVASTSSTQTGTNWSHSTSANSVQDELQQHGDLPESSTTCQQGWDNYGFDRNGSQTMENSSIEEQNDVIDNSLSDDVTEDGGQPPSVNKFVSSAAPQNLPQRPLTTSVYTLRLGTSEGQQNEDHVSSA